MECLTNNHSDRISKATRPSEVAPLLWGKVMKPQFDVSTAGDMPRVVISGNYYGSKCMPSLNNLLAAYGKNPKAGGSLKRKFQRICCDEIRDQLGNWKASKPLIGHFIHYEPRDGHLRDLANVQAFASKVFWDGMQDCGTIKGDDPRYLLNETHDYYLLPDKYGEPRIEIYLEEVDDEC